MKLNSQDKTEIAQILAEKYFSEMNWKWVNLKKDVDRIFKAYEDIEDQYREYPYMSKDWHVENSATKSIHMCKRWDELKDLVDFLNAYSDNFDFLAMNDHKMFCIASAEGSLNPQQKNAILEAKKLRYRIFVFNVKVPDDIEFELMQIGGGI
ncbi:hypothetical protein [Methanohalophilus sp.]|uniref:hypothetical protein n=1 Tax=Methanohalophilus sp. TaxID=1966352 RepID=UPI00260B341C|nr:hypothetical protein [Methanohalophilus sp.]MDK2892895.1 hypothetical protein [Methanohalophilus sp.]